MPSPLRAAFVAALAIGCHQASAQTPVPPAVTVQQIAPQLVTFAGSLSNFENLVAGLAEGSRVQLVSFLADGSAQVATFTPVALPVDQIAPALETARQRLISLGIAAPTAEQIALSVTGGTVPTALGGATLDGLAPASGSSNAPNPPSLAAQMQGNTRIGAATPVTVQNIPAPNRATNTTPAAGTASTAVAAPRVNTSDSPIPSGRTSFSPTPAAGVLTAPGAGSTPPALERATPLAPGSSPILRH